MSPTKSQKPVKPKKCPICGDLFIPFRPLQKCCTSGCAIQWGKKKSAKDSSKAMAEGRRAHRKAKSDSKTRAQWLKEAQTAFNAYIRARDANLPCVSCGRHHTGQYHAGHYMPTSTRPSLRFDERNVHKQCSACNNHKHGNLVLYRVAMVRMFGVDFVEWLEGDHMPAKYTIDELRAIKLLYKHKLKGLQDGINA